MQGLLFVQSGHEVGSERADFAAGNLELYLQALFVRGELQPPSESTNGPNME